MSKKTLFEAFSLVHTGDKKACDVHSCSHFVAANEHSCLPFKVAQAPFVRLSVFRKQHVS